ncbi:SDR family NAD(P)-dependent oxidoreductase [Ahrensia marina]|uniref:Short-chain dehydrogenase n=1 Tax=Ahrensia marina TaxID=1514904 RepID=A0A0M9GPE3_9HYPH|nr:SDR family oxidoreductase [Ahrensia marina]KPB02563.1 short-chain dehydrogenase [Ahrensia marina]
MRALVTGGSAGLGQALCDALLADGFQVVNLDCDPPKVISEAGYLYCDLSSREDVDKALDALTAQAGFDLVIFNAGISATGKFEDISTASHARIIAVNAEAPMVLCAALMKFGKINHGGNIGFVSSLSHFTGYPGAASYAASKDALAVYARAVRKTWQRKFNIKVTAIFPGPLKTDHAARHSPEGADAEKRMTPDEAALLILRDIKKGRAHSILGGAAKKLLFWGKLRLNR